MEKQDWTWQHGEITLLNLIIAQHDEIHFIETTSPTKKESTPQTWFNKLMMEFLKIFQTHPPTNKAGSRDAIASNKVYSVNLVYKI